MLHRPALVNKKNIILNIALVPQITLELKPEYKATNTII